MDDDVVILSVETGEAVRSVGDLKANIQAYKAALDEVEIGSKEYADILNALQVNQAALKNAMHATTEEGDQQGKTMEQISRDAMGLGTSYNSLVRQMAILDQQFRAEEDAVKRAQLGKEINAINSKLKELDAERGKFQRNVGNYQSALTGLGQNFKTVAGSAGAIINPLMSVNSGLAVMSKTPVVGILGLIAGALAKIISGMKGSEENTNRLNRALAAFKPIADAATRTMNTIGKAIADTANWIVDLLDKWGLLNEASQQRIAMEEKNQQIIERQRRIAIENADLENEIAQLRDKAAQKDKYTAEQRIKFLEDAAKWELRIAKNNKSLAEERLAAAQAEAALNDNDAAMNDKLTQLRVAAANATTSYYTTMRRLNKEIQSTKKEIAGGASTITDRVLTEAESILDYLEGEAVHETDPSEFLAPDFSVADDWDTFFAKLVEQRDAYDAALQRQLDIEKAAQEEAAAWQKEHDAATIKARVDTFTAFTSGIATLMGSLADVYEADTEASEEAAAKNKQLQIAAAVISTIGGAVSAFMSTWNAPELGPLAKSILAPINAASVLAAGYAQVRQIQSVKAGKGSGGTVSTPAMVPAPAVGVGGLQQVRTVTGASEEERLNQMASKQKVYLVVSELEAKQEDMKVQLAEATF